MSIHDEFRALATDLFEAFDPQPATLTRKSSGAQSSADRAAGRRNAIVQTINCRALLGSKKVTAEDGTKRIERIATIDVEPDVGDTLKVNDAVHVVVSYEIIDATGTKPLTFKAVLQ